MANTTSNKSKSAKKTTSAPAKSHSTESIRASKYLKNSNIISICVLVSCLTAVLVTLIFNFSMKFWIAAESDYQNNAEANSNSSYSEAYKNEIADVRYDVNNFRLLSSTAIIGMMKTGNSGLVYVEPADCNDACVDFRNQLSFTQTQKSSPVFAVFLNANLSEDDELMLKKFKIDTNGLPTLAYIKEGEVFDRVDSINSIDNLRTFIQKYTAE